MSFLNRKIFKTLSSCHFNLPFDVLTTNIKFIGQRHFRNIFWKIVIISLDFYIFVFSSQTWAKIPGRSCQDFIDDEF